MTKDEFSPSHSGFLQHNLSRVSRWIGAFALAGAIAVLTANSAAAQDPQDQDQNPPPPPAAQGPQDDQAPPPPDAGPDSRPVISRDTIPQDQRDQQDPSQYPSQYPNGHPVQQPPMQNRRPMPQANHGPVPANLTIPPGTVIFVRTNQPLSSDHNHAGDTFTATLDRPIIVNGWVVARRGQTILGTVTTAQKAGRVKGVSQLGLELTDITVVDGQQLPVLTELWKGSAGTSHGADAAGIVTTTGVGTIIGAAANGGEGAGIGAGAGALAGVAMVLLTRGKPTVIGPEALLSFQIKDPVEISTANSQQAFQPVGPYDYNSSPSLRQRGEGYGAYPPPYYASCGPWGCYPYSGYYGPYYGPYIGLGYYGGFYRGGFGHYGFHR